MFIGDLIPDNSPEPPKGVRVGILVKSAVRHAAALESLTGRKITDPAVFEQLVKKLAKIFRADLSAVRISLEIFLGGQQELSSKMLVRIMLKFLQNQHYLRQNLAIPNWEAKAPAWSVLSVRDIDEFHTADKRRLCKLQVACLTGICAGDYMEFVFAPGYLKWMAKEVGFPAYEPVHERDIFRMKFWAKLGTGKDGCSRAITKLAASSSQKTKNRRLAKARLEKQCKFVQVSCPACLMGLDRCELACRNKTRVIEEVSDVQTER